MTRVALPFLLIALNACTALPARQVGAQRASSPAATTPSSAELAASQQREELENPEGSLGPPGEDEELEHAATDASAGRRHSAQAPRPEPEPHPFADLADEALETMLLEDSASLGPMSLGRTSAGALFNAVRMPDGPLWNIVNPRQTWGTTETVEALARCIEHVHGQFPDTQPIYIGDISEPSGGRIDRHLSHQSGRDVDLGYYYTIEHKWYVRADESNLDLPRTWALVKAMITETDVERIFIDHSIQRLLRDHALAAGEDPAWLDRVFGGESTTERPLILHEEGHDTHIHVRFFNPIAQETGRRLYKHLIAHKKISPPVYYVHHKVRRGDTLNRLASKYGTSIKTIKRANGLKSNTIYAGRKYKIPRRGGVIPTAAALDIPPRRLPPGGDGEAPDSVASPER